MFSRYALAKFAGFSPAFLLAALYAPAGHTTPPVLFSNGIAPSILDHRQTPLGFEPGDDSRGGGMKYIARGDGYTILLSATEIEFSPRMRQRLIGASTTARLEALDELPGRVNYFIGDDPKLWRANVPTFAKVKARAVYPGVDVVYYGQRRQWEYDFVVAPGADPRAIKFGFEGAGQIEINADGALILRASDGEWCQRRPVVYQEIDGARRFIAGRYVLDNRNRAGFEIGAYDRSRPLVIDPVVSYATYLGGAGQDFGRAIAVDAAGAVYVTGSTTSANFPVSPGAYTTPGAAAGNAFVAKLNPAGTAFVYTTYFGGSGVDSGAAISVDQSGAAYVTGRTESADFPASPGALQGELKGSSDAFVLKLNPAGSALGYATFLGGSNLEEGVGIGLDAAGNVYAGGNTRSADFPVSSGAYQTALNGAQAAFVVKLDTAGARAYSTYYNLDQDGDCKSLAVDAAGGVFITGGAGRRAGVRGTTQFEAKLGPDGQSVFYTGVVSSSTSLTDFATVAAATDSAGNLYSITNAGFSRIIQGGFAFGPGGGRDPIIFKRTPAGQPIMAIALGGSGDDIGTSVAIDSAGNVYVTGSTTSNDFPTLNPSHAERLGGADIFVAKFNQRGDQLLYSTYLGSTADDLAHGVGADAAGNAYVVGVTNSNAFPVTAGAAQPAFGGGEGAQPQDAVIARIAPGAAPLATVSAANFDGRALARESIVAAFGGNLATTTQAASVLPLPTALGGTTVKVRDFLGQERLAPLFFVSPGQVNFLLPNETALYGTAFITVTNSAGSSLSGTAQIDTIAPALFTANASGQGVAAAVALRVKPDGSRSFEPVAVFDSTQNSFVARPLDLGPDGDELFLILFGTGIRNRFRLADARAGIGGANAEVLFAGPQGDFAGLDQVNLRVPRLLAGRGDADIVLSIDNRLVNVVRVNIK